MASTNPNLDGDKIAPYTPEPNRAPAAPTGKARTEHNENLGATGGQPGRVELTEDDAYNKLGFCFPQWKKWLILTCIFWVQISMNFNASVYSNAVKGIREDFGASRVQALSAQAAFLLAYAFGCELWAPWSEGKEKPTSRPFLGVVLIPSP